MNKKKLNINQLINLKSALIVFLCLVFFQNNFSQTISTSVNKDSIFIGEPIELTIKIDGINNFSPLDFKAGDSIGKNFEVLALGKVDSLQSSIKQLVTITSFELDNQLFPPLGIFVDGKKIISKPIPIHISLVNADTTQAIRDIKTIVSDPLNFKDRIQQFFNWAIKYWYVLLGILLILGLLIWFFFIRKKKVTETKEPAKPQIPAHILAYGSLKELEEKQLWQNGNQKEYNTELTLVVQKYISGRYNVATDEKTSKEILDSLRFIEMGESNKNNLRKLLMLSDLVKFAKEKPSATENEQVLKDAFDFIKTTKQKEN